MPPSVSDQSGALVGSYIRRVPANDAFQQFQFPSVNKNSFLKTIFKISFGLILEKKMKKVNIMCLISHAESL